MRDIVFIGLQWRGKLSPRVFLPPFERAVGLSGWRVSKYDTAEELEEEIRDLVAPVFILVYSEIKTDPAAPKHIEALIADQHPGALIFNASRIGSVIGNKRATNELLSSAGVPVPALVTSSISTERVFSNHPAGSRMPVIAVEPGDVLDQARYNAAFIDTVHAYAGRSYFVALRAMAVTDQLVSVYVRARSTEEGNPSVHNKDTPRDAPLLNHLYFEIVVPRLPQIVRLCEQLGRVLGPGLYAHDLLPCTETGKLIVCETGFKFNDRSLRRHLAPIAQDLAVADFLSSTEATRSASAFLHVLHGMR